jgi:hypothetical protein
VLAEIEGLGPHWALIQEWPGEHASVLDLFWPSWEPTAYWAWGLQISWVLLRSLSPKAALKSWDFPEAVLKTRLHPPVHAMFLPCPSFLGSAGGGVAQGFLLLKQKGLLIHLLFLFPQHPIGGSLYCLYEPPRVASMA